ncbi:regulator of chromosome condensation 1/beta-lactamase-inhibitor protein II [Baffinella frigidus]|nr:regulator of chromosome condensation 1/beta-lactamase-inhibitor protein II [Cryptophyta sp. CCMP2293]
MPFHSVYTCGHGAGGRLGLSDELPRSKFVGPLGTLEGVAIEAIECGSKHTLLLTQDGEVYSWGYNQYGQTGHGPQGLAQWEPRIIKGLEGIRIVQVLAGEEHSLALSEHGEVFAWGRGTQGQLGHGDVKDVWFPFLIRSLQGKAVTSLGRGHNCSWAITSTGKVWGFGTSGAGQLGNGDTDGGIGGSVTMPVLLKSLQKHHIVQASGGINFAMFLTEYGELLSVGYAANGQLGISFDKVEELDRTYTSAIQRVEHTGIVMKLVSCGDSCSVALSDSGMVYTWGSGGDWALGHGQKDDVFTPKLVSMIEADPCVAVSAGGCHMMAVSHGGRLYAWGRGFIGQLGLGHRLDDDLELLQALPAKVDFSPGMEGSELAMCVACGHCHSIIQTALAGDEPEREVARPVVVEPEEKTAAPRVAAAAPAAKMETSKAVKQFLTLVVEVLSGRNLAAKDVESGSSDPYCKVKVKDGRTKQKEKTKVISKTRDPSWNETFTFKGCVNRIAIEGDPRMKEPGQAPTLNWDVKLKVSCYDQDKLSSDEHMGVVFVPLAGTLHPHINVVQT